MFSDCLQRIIDEFANRRKKAAIIKRMLQLHIIADKLEILKQKQRKHKAKNVNDTGVQAELNEDEFNEELPTISKASRRETIVKSPKSKQRKVVRTPLDVGTVRALLGQIDEKYRVVIDWLKECLDEAADDMEEVGEDDDGVPLVPLQDLQKEAMEDDSFKKVLVALGIQPPVFGMENYWRIPMYLNSADLKLRAKIVAGELIEVNFADIEESDNTTDEEKSEANIYQKNDEETKDDYLETLSLLTKSRKLDSLETYNDQCRYKLKKLLFNKSDEETEDPQLKSQKHAQTLKESIKNQDKSAGEESDGIVEKIRRNVNKNKINIDLSSEDEDDERESPKKAEQGEPVQLSRSNLFDQLRSKRAQNKTKLGQIVCKKDSEQAEDNMNWNFNSGDYRKRFGELGDDNDNSQNREKDNDKADTKSHKVQSLGNPKYQSSHRTHVIQSDSDDDVVVDNVNKSNKEDNEVFNGDIINTNVGSTDDAVKSVSEQQTGENINYSTKATSKKRQRPVDESITEETVQEDNDKNADILQRRNPSPLKQFDLETGERPVKRRRVTVIDEDE